MSNQESEATLTFEESLSKLEAIVESLENGETPLDDLVKQYEKGVQLLENCRKRLGDAEMRIQKIDATKEGFQLEPMESEAGQ